MKTFTVEVTQVVTVTQADREAARAYINEGRFRDCEEITEGGWDNAPIVQAFARHRIACVPDDLTAASQLEHSGPISREKYNHIVENIRARESIRGAMA